MRKSLGPIAALLLGVAFLLAGNGVHFTLLPLRGNAEGFSDVALGVIGSSYYIGFVSGCVAGPYFILRAGHIRAFAAMVAVASAVALAYALAATVPTWIFFRFLTGFCLAGLYLVIESWLNDRADNATRGLVMSTYIIINFAALMLAQWMVTLYPIAAAGTFMLSAILCSLAIVPVALTRSAQPAPITIVTFRPMVLYRAAPVALVAAFMIGVANGAFWGLGPLSVANAGLGVQQVAGFMSLAVFAGALMQWPAGRLSDRVDRRLVLLVLLVLASFTGLLMWLLSVSGSLLMAFGFLFGALVLPGYALAAAHGYDKTPASEMVPTAATILLANGLGSAIGPLAGSAVMAAGDPRGLFLFTAITQIILAAYVFYRIRVQTTLTPQEKTEFDLAATSEVGAVMPPETIDPEDASVAVPEGYRPSPEPETEQERPPEPEPTAPPDRPPEDAVLINESKIEILPPEPPRGPLRSP
jgi:MFS family permease